MPTQSLHGISSDSLNILVSNPCRSTEARAGRGRQPFSRVGNTLWILRANLRFLSWVGKTERCYTRKARWRDPAGPRDVGEPDFVSLLLCGWEKGRVGKRERGTEDMGKATAAPGKDVFHPSSPLCQLQLVPLQNGWPLDCSGGHKELGHFEAIWTLISQAAAYFSCVQSQSCKIFYLLLKRSVCNLLQIYFNISRTTHMKRLGHKRHKLLLHFLYTYCY